MHAHDIWLSLCYVLETFCDSFLKKLGRGIEELTVLKKSFGEINRNLFTVIFYCIQNSLEYLIYRHKTVNIFVCLCLSENIFIILYTMPGIYSIFRGLYIGLPSLLCRSDGERKEYYKTPCCGAFFFVRKKHIIIINKLILYEETN